MSFAIYAIRDHRYSICVVRAASEDAALDAYMDIQRNGQAWHGVPPEPKTNFKAIPTNMEDDDS